MAFCFLTGFIYEYTSLPLRGSLLIFCYCECMSMKASVSHANVLSFSYIINATGSVHVYVWHSIQGGLMHPHAQKYFSPTSFSYQVRLKMSKIIKVTVQLNAYCLRSLLFLSRLSLYLATVFRRCKVIYSVGIF